MRRTVRRRVYYWCRCGDADGSPWWVIPAQDEEEARASLLAVRPDASGQTVRATPVR